MPSASCSHHATVPTIRQWHARRSPVRKSRNVTRRTPASGTPSARNAAKRNEHGFGVLARAQRSEHVRPSLESNPRGQQSTYDAMGSLITVSLPDGRLIEYVTDGKGRRIGKMVNGVLTKQWLYRDQLKPVAELDGSGNLVGEFIYGSKPNVPDLVVRGGVTYRVVSDQLGSPVLAINTANSSDIPFQATYAAFGERTLVAGTDDWMPFGFAGGQYDPDTKLTRFGARDYDARIGRWVSKDPIRFRSRQQNFYVYVSNDPINKRDAAGLDAVGQALQCVYYAADAAWTCYFPGSRSECGNAGSNVLGACVDPVADLVDDVAPYLDPSWPGLPSPSPTHPVPECFVNDDWNLPEPDPITF